MSATKAVERVQQLVALAGNNPNEHEARTAAYQACRIIREQGLVVVTKAEAERLRPSALDDLIADMQRQAAEATRKATEAWEAEQAARTWPESPKPKRTRPKKEPSPGCERHRVDRAPGVGCAGCSRSIPKDEHYWSVKGGRWPLCDGCFKRRPDQQPAPKPSRKRRAA